MALFDALLAIDPNSLASAAGLAGKVYDVNDTVRSDATALAVTDLNGIPYANKQIVAGVNGFIPPFLTPGDEVAVVWVSGPWVFPLKSIEGVAARADAAQSTADEALALAEAGGGGGGGTGASTVDGITDATATGRNLLKAASAAAARTVIGAGTSDLTLGTGATQAAAGDAVVRLTGAQTVQGQKTFQSAPVVPAESFPVAATAGLRSELDTLTARAGFVVLANQGDDPIAAGGRPGDVVFYVTATPDGGGDPEPPADTTSLRRRFLTGVADGATHTLAGGTGDTVLTAQSGTQAVQVVGGIPRVHVVGSSAITWRDNPSTATPAGDLPALGVFSVDVLLRIAAYPASSTAFMTGTGAFQLSIGTTGGITVLTSAGTAAPSSVGGSAGSASAALALDTDYHVKIWRPATTTNTLSQFAVYAADNTTMVWPTTGTPANRDIGVANMTAWIRGKTGAVAGEWLIGQERLDDVGVALAAI